MSEMESVAGIAKKIGDLSFSEQSFKEVIDTLVDRSVHLEDIDYEDEYFWSDEVVRFKDDVYLIQEKQGRDPSGWIDGEMLSDGSIQFDCYFYNGGCSSTEAIEEAIKKATGGSHGV